MFWRPVMVIWTTFRKHSLYFHPVILSIMSGVGILEDRGSSLQELSWWGHLSWWCEQLWVCTLTEWLKTKKLPGKQLRNQMDFQLDLLAFIGTSSEGIINNKPLQGMAPTECLLSAFVLDCFLTCLPAHLICLPSRLLLACLLACLLTCLLKCLLACLLPCLLACLLPYLLACLLACLLAYLFLGSCRSQ